VAIVANMWVNVIHSVGIDPDSFPASCRVTSDVRDIKDTALPPSVRFYFTNIDTNHHSLLCFTVNVYKICIVQKISTSAMIFNF
jgi:hypothetical protein